jgi:hypothetical protein
VAIIARQNAGMERFDVAAVELLPGQRVRIRVLSHQSWGVGVEIIGQESVGASVDMIQCFGGERMRREGAELTPAVGAEVGFVSEKQQRM